MTKISNQPLSVLISDFPDVHKRFCEIYVKASIGVPNRLPINAADNNNIITYMLKFKPVALPNTE